VGWEKPLSSESSSLGVLERSDAGFLTSYVG
jgi:hypothetical protein